MSNGGAHEDTAITCVAATSVHTAEAYYRGDEVTITPSPESVHKELILCEKHISNFFNADHFITKSNYVWL
jgi:hypothetical protein